MPNMDIKIAQTKAKADMVVFALSGEFNKIKQNYGAFKKIAPDTNDRIFGRDVLFSLAQTLENEQITDDKKHTVYAKTVDALPVFQDKQLLKLEYKIKLLSKSNRSKQDFIDALNSIQGVEKFNEQDLKFYNYLKNLIGLRVGDKSLLQK